MFEVLLAKLLVNYFGLYFEGLDKKNLNVQAWSFIILFIVFSRKGNITLENLKINPSLIE